MTLPLQGQPEGSPIGVAQPSFGGAVTLTNGVESFWSMLKQAAQGVYHQFSSKHLKPRSNRSLPAEH